MRIRYLVAMEREAASLGFPCEALGIGGMPKEPVAKDDIIVNVGYCGSNSIPVGTIVEPIVAVDWKGDGFQFDGEDVIFLDQHFDCEKAACFTSDEFVTESPIKSAAIFDMELAGLGKLGCARLYCLKIVSDALDEEACEEFDGAGAWARVREMLMAEGLWPGTYYTVQEYAESIGLSLLAMDRDRLVRRAISLCPDGRPNLSIGGEALFRDDILEMAFRKELNA